MTRPLNKLEMREFEKTFDFINHYIGSSSHYDNVDSIHDLRFDGQKVNYELIEFVNNKFDGCLKKINLWFNDAKKEKVMPSLIKYCFDNRVQPHRLRMTGNFSIYEMEIVTEEFRA